MSGADWQPGDLALCVNDVGAINVVAGGIYTFVGMALNGTGLIFHEVRAIYQDFGAGFRADRFRKIRPHTPDAEDAETIALLTGEPAQVSA